MGTEDIVILSDLNLTELREMYKNKFGTPIGIIPRDIVIESLRRGEELDEGDRVDEMRRSLLLFLHEHWGAIKNQIKCSGYCYDCPDGMVTGCYIDNKDQLGGEMPSKKCGLDPRQDYTLKELEDSEADKDHAFLLQACMNRKLINVSEVNELTTESLWEKVKESASEEPKEEKEKPKKSGKRGWPKGKPRGPRKKKEDAEPKKKPAKGKKPPPAPSVPQEVDLSPVIDKLVEIAASIDDYASKVESISDYIAAVEKGFEDKLRYVMKLSGYDDDTIKALTECEGSPFVSKSSKK
jgi:hypothetical protein